MSPTFRIDAVSTLGGGSTTAGSGMWTLRFERAELTSAAGATTVSASVGAAFSLFFTSGGGATTAVVISGNRRSVARLVAANGTAGFAGPHATTFGSGTS